jgi:hypothetical protein
MRITTHLLLVVLGSVMALTASPTQAGGSFVVGSHYRYKSFHVHDHHRGFHRYRGHRGHYRYRGHYRGHYRYGGHFGSHRLHYKRYGPYGHPAPPYSGTIRGELAELYRSGPDVYVHHGADAPVWSEYHLARHDAAPQTMLHIVMASPSGAVSVDGHPLGQAGTWPQGRMRLPIAPGTYTVQLHRAGIVYSRQIYVYEGMATVVTAALR